MKEINPNLANRNPQKHTWVVSSHLIASMGEKNPFMVLPSEQQGICCTGDSEAGDFAPADDE
jgi:hypothetical protein